MATLFSRSSGRKRQRRQGLRWSRWGIAIRDSRKRRKRINTYLSQAREVLSFLECKVIDNAGVYPLTPLTCLYTFTEPANVADGGPEP